MGTIGYPENSVKKTTILRCVEFQQGADLVIFLSTLFFHIQFWFLFVLEFYIALHKEMLIWQTLN
jgi:hypothetical protein